jgi:radical SAM protein with 4Fe4S-binding SPASM domain
MAVGNYTIIKMYRNELQGKSLVFSLSITKNATLSERKIKCQNCFYIAVCTGGRPYFRLKNKFENTERDCCAIIKGNLSEFLTAHYLIKKIK